MALVRSAVDLLDAVESLGLVPHSQAGTLRTTFTAEPTLTAHEALHQLVERGLLTTYQAERLSAGEEQSLVIGGRYRIRELRGAGGMGTVFLAVDGQLGRNVALKILPARLVRDTGAVARFEREAKAMGRLAHGNIVQAYDSGSCGDQHFLVMEFIDGVSLGALLKQRGPLEPSTAADYAYQTALGLQHAHDKGLVHRDLKPANLIITPEQQVKILDLGLARFLHDQVEDETLTIEGTALGTPDYMAPEQFGHAREADERSDVYALGCTLYHMLAGRVPYPGSSFSEKQLAHQRTEPEPVEAFQPQVPAGLSQVVLKMMAKRPADRFASAGQCAEALLPFVAASSHSLPNLKATTTWHGGQLHVVTEAARRRRLLNLIGIGAVLLVASTMLNVAVSRFWDRPPAEVLSAAGNGTSPSAQGKGEGEAATAPQQPEANSGNSDPTPVATVDPWLLTVTQDASDGGQYRTIREALAQARPGMTIRINDGKTYQEQIAFDDPARHAGITLEGTGATVLKPPVGAKYAVAIDSVPDVRLSNLTLEGAGSPVVYLVFVHRHTPGTVLERLNLRDATGSSACGVGVEAVELKAGEPPLTIEKCTIANLAAGVRVSGASNAPHTPMPVRGIVLRDNDISRCDGGIVLVGQLSDLQIVGNRLHNLYTAGILVGGTIPIFQGSRGLLIANNTILMPRNALMFAGPIEAGCEIRIHNNLLLAETGPDLAYSVTDSSVSQTWHLSHNVRRVTSTPTAADSGWLVASDNRDTFVVDSELVPTDPTSPATFLRPAEAAPRLLDGAGHTEPSLPTYIGALPPPGMEPWDWSRTWHAPPGTSQLLTVSEKPEDGGQFRTLAEALTAAEPWATVRVLDTAAYPGPLRLDQPDKHLGVMLDSPGGATIQLVSGISHAVFIADAAHVRVQGFRFADAQPRPGATMIHVAGECDEIVLKNLTFTNDIQSIVYGIRLDQVRPGLPSDRAVRPTCSVRIQGCRFTMASPNLANSGCDIALAINGAGPNAASMSGGFLIVDNVFTGALRGIHVVHSMENVLIAGNTIRECIQESLGLEDWGETASHVQVVNNSLATGQTLVRFWDNPPQEIPATGHLDFRANLLLEAGAIDMVYWRAGTAQPDEESQKTAQTIFRTGRFTDNFRDDSGNSYVLGRIASQDRHRLSRRSFESTDPRAENYLRPLADSDVATGGVGGDLPAYAGAIPPAGVERWDWERTWRSLALRATYFDESP